MTDTWWVRPEQLDEDQREVVSLPPDQDFLITGPPGSGKTNLLLLRANYFVLSDKPNILLLTFTRTLREFVVTGGSNYAFDGSRIKTFVSWMSEMLGQDANQILKDSNFENLRSRLCKMCIELVSNEKQGKRYDAILIDEAQDCLPEEIELARRLGKFLFVVADENQKIYSDKGGLSKVHEFIKPDQRHHLQFHYRNGTAICQLADEILRPSEDMLMLPSSQYYEEDSPSSVTEFVSSNSVDHLLKLKETLKLQLAAYPEELFGVLCPLKGTVKEVGDWLLQSELADDCIVQSKDSSGYQPFTEGKRICITTIHSAKGLEFRTVHLMDAGSINRFRQNQIKLAYTAVTRAKTSLSVYHKDDLPHFLNSAIRSIKKKEISPPDLSSLFRGK